MPELSSKDRLCLMDVMSTCINKTIDDILNIRIDNPGHTKIDTGYLVDTKLTIPAGGFFLNQLKQAAIHHGFPLDDRVQVVSDENFRIDFGPDPKTSSQKPVLVVNVIDGKLALCNYLAEITRRQREYGSIGTDLIHFMPTSAMSAALFEGPKYSDITMGVVGLVSRNPSKDIVSAYLEHDRFLGYINKTRIMPDRSRYQLSNEQSRVLVLASTNYNSEGIGAVKDHLTHTRQFLEVRSECTGTSVGDIFLLINNMYHAMVDFRAFYPDSWATLRLRNAAPLIPLADAFRWQLSAISGHKLDEELEKDILGNGHYSKNRHVLDNRELTLLITKTEELRTALLKSLDDELPSTKVRWLKNKDYAFGPRHPDYVPIESKKSTPFKISYLGRHKITDTVKFIHVLVLNKDGEEYCSKNGISPQEYIKKECQIESKGLKHDNILSPSNVAIHYGHVMIVEPPCKSNLSIEYPEMRINNYAKFMEHAKQILEGINAAHSLPSPFIHGDIKLENIGLDDSIIKIDDWGVTSMMIRANIKEYRSKSVGSVLSRAPEEFVNPGEKSVKTDIYSIGALMFRMLTGAYPIHNPQEKKPPISDKIEREKYESKVQYFRCENPDYEKTIKERLSGIPPELSDYVATLLSRDPDQRPASARDALGWLNSILALYNGIHKKLPD